MIRSASHVRECFGISSCPAPWQNSWRTRQAQEAVQHGMPQSTIAKGHAPTFWLSREHVLGIEVAGQHWELAISDRMQSFQQTDLHSSLPALITSHLLIHPRSTQTTKDWPALLHQGICGDWDRFWLLHGARKRRAHLNEFVLS